MRFAIAARMAVVAALAVSVAACGSDSSADPAASQAEKDNARDTARAKLSQCLREQGVDVPAGGGVQQSRSQMSDADREEMQEAMRGPCARYRQQMQDARGVDDQEMQDALAKLRDCMRKQGIDVPAASESGGGPLGGAGLDRDDPDVQAAMETCRDELPDGFRGGRR